MNILMLNRFDIYSIPGTVRMVELARQFVQKGHSVTLAYYPAEDRRKYLPLLRNSDPLGINVIKLNSNKTAFFNNIKQVLPHTRSADIIHFQKCFPETALPALWLAYWEDKPLHYDWDDLEEAIVPEWTVSNVIYRIVRKYELELPALVNSISYSTEYIRQLALERGANESYLISAPVGADIEQFHPARNNAKIKNLISPNKSLIIYIGQLEGGSYAELFILAAKILIQTYPDIHFLIVGGGNRLPALQDKTANWGLNSYFTFTNYISHAQIPDYIAAADICVACFEDNLITRSKSPLKIAEYMAAGKPIVASAVGDIPKMLDGAGILVPPGNVEQLAKAILSLLNNKNQIDDMKIKARLQAELYYNWSIIAERFLQLYEKVIQDFKK